jgi:hypothetical protein
VNNPSSVMCPARRQGRMSSNQTKRAAPRTLPASKTRMATCIQSGMGVGPGAGEATSPVVSQDP